MIVGLYAGVCGLLVLALAMRVMRLRDRHGVGLGSDGHGDLARAIRAHANAIEYVPLALLLLAMLAMENTQAGWLHTFGIALVIARLLHAFGLSRHPGRSFGRFVGAGLTLVVMLAMAVWLIVKFVVAA